MANPRQRRKARSSTNKIQSSRRQIKKLKKFPAIRGSEYIQRAWDPKLTVNQNFAKLGLASNLDFHRPGGTDPAALHASAPASEAIPYVVEPAAPIKSSEIPKGMARIVRDADGNVIQVIIPDDDEEEASMAVAQEPEAKPWGERPEQPQELDPSGLRLGWQFGSEVREPTAVVKELEKLAATARPAGRKTSSSELVWLQSMVKKHGKDTNAMARDLKLNVWQKTRGEIEKAIRRAGGFEALQ